MIPSDSSRKKTGYPVTIGERKTWATAQISVDPENPQRSIAAPGTEAIKAYIKSSYTAFSQSLADLNAALICP